MKNKILLLMVIQCSLSSFLYAQLCTDFEKVIRQNKNVVIRGAIASISAKFLTTKDGKHLDQLTCFLTSIPGQIDDTISLLDIIKNLKNIHSTASFSNLLNLHKTLDAYEKICNDLYVKYMKQIDESADLKDERGRSIVPQIDPESIFAGYEALLNKFKKSNPKTALGVINFLRTNKKLESDSIKERRSAQQLYDRLNQLEVALLEANKRTKFDFYNYNKRKNQIILIDKIKKALSEKFGDFVSYSTTLPIYYEEKAADTSDKYSVILATVAGALHDIIQELNDTVYAILQRPSR